MRVLVCGGRDYSERETFFRSLDQLHADLGFTVVIEGGAEGADALAARWAELRDLPCIRFVADWRKYGRAAGPLRNRQMLEEGKPDLVVAFPGGRGTADMMKRARANGVEVFCPAPAPQSSQNGAKPDQS